MIIDSETLLNLKKVLTLDLKIRLFFLIFLLIFVALLEMLVLSLVPLYVALLINSKNFNEVISFGKKLGKLLVITRGDKGSIAIQKNKVVECKSKKNLRIVDLTGAGDLFASGFLHGHVNNLSIKESLEKGTEMSSKIIQKMGARLN